MDKGHFLRRLRSPPLHSSPREQMSGRGNTTMGRRDGGCDVSHQWGSYSIISSWNFSSLLCICTSWSFHPPHKELTNTDAKQGQMSLQWQVGSMGAWGGEMVRAEMELHNSNKGLGEWMREEERMRNMWYFNKRYQGRSWWFRDSCLLKSETFF